ncbi:5-oxoprolinase subunit PxpB [Helicobacter labacensis]|uniref:5-oxoprolinase subunit PxpB n=1 Tax=Helicobacter labacensis TaxID=2316079 RepID=UPI001F43C307|nr:5-oxoprolinase subunit PxpB [Helicobacter labacensis]
MIKGVKYFAYGQSALLLDFGAQISPKTHTQIQKVRVSLEARRIKGVVELVPAYCTLLIHYDPLVCSYGDLIHILDHLDIQKEHLEVCSYLVEIPACYAPEFGQDLASVCAHTKLSAQEVIDKHSAPDYLVYMLGFLPGFAYLGGLDALLATPRLATPRVQVAPGSIGIAGMQTGIYPLASPGGWQIIARTPLELYNPSKDPPVFLQPGDRVRFVPISIDTYHQIAKEVQEGVYTLKRAKRSTHG